MEGVDPNAKKIDLREEVDKVRKREQEIALWGKEEYEENITRIKKSVEEVVKIIRSKA